jgi:C-8 sterol isomerase
MAAIHAELYAKYPGRVLHKDSLQWTFINQCGVMCSACLLHGSITEYVMFYGCVMDTSGHSGQ